MLQRSIDGVANSRGRTSLDQDSTESERCLVGPPLAGGIENRTQVLEVGKLRVIWRLHHRPDAEEREIRCASERCNDLFGCIDVILDVMQAVAPAAGQGWPIRLKSIRQQHVSPGIHICLMNRADS